MLTMKQLLPTTPRIWLVSPDMPIADATALMARQGIESLLVLEGGALRGMLTTEDCATNVPTQLPTTQGIRVRSVMRQTTEAEATWRPKKSPRLRLRIATELATFTRIVAPMACVAVTQSLR